MECSDFEGPLDWLHFPASLHVKAPWDTLRAAPDLQRGAEDPDTWHFRRTIAIREIIWVVFPSYFVLSISNKNREDAILKVALIYLEALKSNGEFLPEHSKQGQPAITFS